MLIQEVKEILQDQAHIVQGTYLESFQIHQLTMYCFEHTNHYILNVFFQNPYKLFLRLLNLHQYYVPYLSDCENPLFQVMMFHLIFPNHPYMYKDIHLFAIIIDIMVKIFVCI